MGCGSSHPNAAELIERPEDEVDLSVETLNQALIRMAEFIAKRKRHLTLVVAGGVVSTMLLRIRASTHDVDYCTQLGPEDRRLLKEASNYARQKTRNPKPNANWFNNRMIVWMDPDVHVPLAAESERLDAIVFRARGLTLLAAPWAYQFCMKLGRMAGGGGRSHDAADAAAYLHRYLTSQNTETISYDQIRHLLQRYKIRDISRNGLLRVFEHINTAFVPKYGNVVPIRH